MYERHTYEEMTYSLPSREGKVTLILKFAEVMINASRCTSVMPGNVFSISNWAVR